MKLSSSVERSGFVIVLSRGTVGKKSIEHFYSLVVLLFQESKSVSWIALLNKVCQIAQTVLGFLGLNINVGRNN